MRESALLNESFLFFEKSRYKLARKLEDKQQQQQEVEAASPN